MNSLSDIIYLNVGGTKFATSKQTLTSVDDTFFTSLLSSHQLISPHKDSSNAFFIDRDPNLFQIILNYLRTRQLINPGDVSIEAILHEAQFYGITPLVKRLQIYQNLINKEICGGSTLFQGLLKRADSSNPQPVKKILAQVNTICVAFSHQVNCYLLKDALGWVLIFKSDMINEEINDIAFSHKVDKRLIKLVHLMIGLCLDDRKSIRLWLLALRGDHAIKHEVGKFSLEDCAINSLLFIGSQLVALSYEEGRVGVYHYTSQHWLVQNLKEHGSQSITAFDKAGCNFLLLGSRDGSIYLIDMQKFPLRMKDGDLLINEIYEDPEREEITGISCYLTRHQNSNGNWLEIAYGTSAGTVRVLVQHPETVGHGPQLFQTYKVHLHGIAKVMLNEKYLISLCNKMHVRTWSFTRFRGIISTQPGSSPFASFKILALDASDFDENVSDQSISDEITDSDQVGPFGDQVEGDKQVFIEKLKSQTDHINVLLASNGERLCTLTSVDNSLITSYYVHECDAISVGNRPKKYILTGHSSGSVQIWDLSSALDRASKHQNLMNVNRKQLLKELIN